MFINPFKTYKFTNQIVFKALIKGENNAFQLLRPLKYSLCVSCLFSAMNLAWLTPSQLVL